MGTWFVDPPQVRAGDVIEAKDGSTFVVTRADDRGFVYGTDTLPQSDFPPLDIEELHGGLVRVLRNGGVVWVAREREPVDLEAIRAAGYSSLAEVRDATTVPRTTPPQPARTDTFPPDRFGKAARYLLDVLQGRQNVRWTIEDAVEAARQAGLGTVNMQAAIEQLLAEGIIVRLRRPEGGILLTETGSNYYNAWKFVNPRA